MGTREIRSRVEAFYRKHYDGVAPRWSVLIDEVLGLGKEAERIELLKRCVPLSAEWKILEIGSGFGGFALAMSMRGYCVTCVEPDRDCVEVLMRRFSAHDLEPTVIESGAERLPLADGSVDCIVSFQVLEHVSNVGATLDECRRVLKPGGYLYLVVPNYSSIWEPHYATLFPLFLGKTAFRAWISLLGRKHYFLESLNFVTSRSLRRMVQERGFRIHSVGKELFAERFKAGNVPTWGQSSPLTLLANATIALRLDRAIVRILNAADMHYPVNLVGRKCQP